MESNKLIAEFMELETETFSSGILNYYHQDIAEGSFFEEHELSYHISWDWLMPVVEKIESLRNGSGDAYRFNIDMCNVDIENTEINITSTHKIKATHQAVVEFITTLSVRTREDIINRLEFWDSGDGVDFEYWRDTETEFVYQVPIEIVRDFNEIKKVNVG